MIQKGFFILVVIIENKSTRRTNNVNGTNESHHQKNFG